MGRMPVTADFKMETGFAATRPHKEMDFKAEVGIPIEGNQARQAKRSGSITGRLSALNEVGANRHRSEMN